MKRDELLKILYSVDSVDIYREFQKIENSIEDSNYYYQYINDFIDMLSNELSYVRIRGFRLICKLAIYDDKQIINNNIDLLLKELDDDRPTNVRQALSSLNTLLLYKPELSTKIENKLKSMDLTKYKDSMSPLIKKDIDYILNHL